MNRFSSLNHYPLRKETGFTESDHVLEGEMRIGAQEHFYLETQVTIAAPKGEAGEMELFVSTQNQSKTQELVAEALGVPNDSNQTSGRRIRWQRITELFLVMRSGRGRR